MDVPSLTDPRPDPDQDPDSDPDSEEQLKEPALKADHDAQLRLLDLQVLDSRADQLRHQRQTLPEIAEIATLQSERDQLDDQRRDARIVVDDLTIEQAKVDADVEAVRTRRTRDQDRMDQGLISNPKDLERMQGELVSLQRRIATLEDEELEVMVRLEEAQGTLDDLVARIEQADVRLAELIVARDDKTAVIVVDLDGLGGERGPLAAVVPDDLLALYEKLRDAKGGVGAAELRARSCGGCRLAIDNAELAVIAAAAPELVVRCEECSRILIRTAESGL